MQRRLGVPSVAALTAQLKAKPVRRTAEERRAEDQQRRAAELEYDAYDALELHAALEQWQEAHAHERR